ncbi:hypothetical protein ACUSIJ_02290 [Pseudochelatococcus sp. B33]
MANPPRQDATPGSPHDDRQADDGTRAKPDAKPGAKPGAKPDTPAGEKSGSNFLDEYIKLNTKIVQNVIDSFSLNGFYFMFDNVFKLMGGPSLASSARDAEGLPRQGGGGVRPAMNLREIEDALTRLMAVAVRPKADGFATKEPLSSDIIRRMMNGYAYVDQLLCDGVDLFSHGSSHHWLELNHLVLCGTTPERREQFRHHIEETERRFYDDSVGGIGERMEWLSRRRADGPVALAAGIFLHITSSPQLFIEGNCRTATLIASHALVSAGLPPIVVTERNYQAFFALTDDCKLIERPRWDQALTFRRESGRIEEFIRATADRRYLADGAAPAGAARPPDA